MSPRPSRAGPFVCLPAVLLLLAGCGGGSGSGSADGAVVARADPAGAGSTKEAGGAQRGLVVDVAGHVGTPGVYELPKGARVHEALAAAGGVRRGAVLGGINRAAEVVDGQQVVVPGPGVATPTAAAGTGTSAGAGAGTTVSLNGADVAALDALPGIGPITAQRIVDDREANGPFTSVADLDRVPGVGPSTVTDLEGRVTP